MSQINKLLDEYIETRLAYDEAHEASVRADKQHKAVKAKLVEAMLAEQQTGLKMEYGIAFHLRNNFSIACNQDNEEQLKEWLHEHYGDASDFIVEKLYKPRIEERLKADIEGGALDEFNVPEFVGLKTRPEVSCTGWKQFAAQRRA